MTDFGTYGGILERLVTINLLLNVNLGLLGDVITFLVEAKFCV